MELDAPDDPIVGILELLAAHTEQLSNLDAETSGLADAAGRTAEFAALARQLDLRITVLGARLDKISPPGIGEDEWEPAYVPRASRRWWKLAGQDRETALADLRAWVEQIYRPGYGQLAATLSPCWDQHPLCLYAVDILAELWSVLYLPDYRPASLLTDQAEYQTRILPAFADQMAVETGRCRAHLTRTTTPGIQHPQLPKAQH